MAGHPFYIAHRGGRLNWPEMTAYAYAQAAALPYVKAIEISVCATSDGVLVCSHDRTTARVTGVPYEISQVPWATLSELTVKASETNNPDQPPQPFSRLDEVIEQHIQELVVFIEPKVKGALEPLKAMLRELNQPERTVWKHPVNSGHFAWAKEQGFTTWGYVLDEPAHSFDQVAEIAAGPNVDMLGVERVRTDEVTRQIVDLAGNAGKRTITWSISTAEERARALSLGCQGLMTANIRDLPATPL